MTKRVKTFKNGKKTVVVKRRDGSVKKEKTVDAEGNKKKIVYKKNGQVLKTKEQGKDGSFFFKKNYRDSNVTKKFGIVRPKKKFGKLKV
jgi:hypothetical protein